jgi:dihydroorotate dehydrogenase
MTSRLATTIGRLALPNPVICGSGELVMTEAGIRAALHAGAAGVIAKSVNERPEAARNGGTMAGRHWSRAHGRRVCARPPPPPKLGG